MKILLLPLCFLLTFSARAQIYVNIIPSRPSTVIVQPPPPSPRHVWVAEDWVWKNNHYEHVGGYWAASPKNNYKFKPGYWEKSPKGYKWKNGKWFGGHDRGKHKGYYENHDQNEHHDHGDYKNHDHQH